MPIGWSNWPGALPWPPSKASPASSGAAAGAALAGLAIADTGPLMPRQWLSALTAPNGRGLEVVLERIQLRGLVRRGPLRLDRLQQAGRGGDVVDEQARPRRRGDHEAGQPRRRRRQRHDLRIAAVDVHRRPAVGAEGDDELVPAARLQFRGRHHRHRLAAAHLEPAVGERQRPGPAAPARGAADIR